MATLLPAAAEVGDDCACRTVIMRHASFEMPGALSSIAAVCGTIVRMLKLSDAQNSLPLSKGSLSADRPLKLRAAPNVL